MFKYIIVREEARSKLRPDRDDKQDLYNISCEEKWLLILEAHIKLAECMRRGVQPDPVKDIQHKLAAM